MLEELVTFLPSECSLMTMTQWMIIGN